MEKQRMGHRDRSPRPGFLIVVMSTIFILLFGSALPLGASPSFRWERVPASLTQGRATELSLVLVNWDFSRPIPRNLFGGRIPEKVIMEELPFSREDTLIRYPIKIIPLEEGSFIFGPLSVQLGGLRLEIPRLSLPVAALPVTEAPALSTDCESIISEYEAEEILFPDGDIPFPQEQGMVLPFFRTEYNRIISQTRELWEEGRRPEALALIRMHERDSLSGPFLVPLRRDMEMKLGLTFTADEAWRIWNLRAFPWIILAILLPCLMVFFRKKIRSFILKPNKNLIPLAALGGLGIILLFTGLGLYFGGLLGIQSRSAVLERTAAYRVPETTGTVLLIFDEGQPVRILSSTGPWIYAESIDGRSGWVPAEKVYPY